MSSNLLFTPRTQHRILAAWVLAASTAAAGAATISIAKKVELQTGLPRTILTNDNWIYGAIPARDGSYFAVAQRTNGCSVLSLNTNASVSWERPVASCDSFQKLLELRDGSLVHLAASRLTRFASNGEFQSGTLLEGGSFYDIVPHPDGFLLGGTVLNETIVIQLVTTNMETIWRRTYPGYFVPGNLRSTPGRGYVYGHGGGGRGGGVTQVDIDGNVEFDKSFTGGIMTAGGENFVSFCPVRTGGYLLVYQSAALPGADKTAPNFGGSDYWLVRIDAAGRKLWDRSYGGNGEDGAVFATETEDSGFVVVGQSFSGGVSGNKSVDGTGIWILKIDSGGFKEAEHLIPGHLASVFPKATELSVYAWPGDNFPNSLFSVVVTEHRRIVISARTTPSVPYNIDVSADLGTWMPLVTGCFGDLELKEPLSAKHRFYRVWEP
jgi:hypothetical protein